MGVQKVIAELKLMGKTRRGKKMKKAVEYFQKHINHMQYALLDEMKLPVGSGQVESAVRRVINLRFKSNGTFWKGETVEELMHLRAFFKAGRWEELMNRVLTGEFKMPSFLSKRQRKRNSDGELEIISFSKHPDELQTERRVA